MSSSRRHPSAAQSATSLPVAPADDAGIRVRNYLLTMAIRITCLVLMVFVTPYGWYSFVFAAGAVFLPYFAVVGANAASGRTVTVAERPDTAIEAAAPPDEEAPADPAPPSVIRIAESPARTPDRPPTAPPAPNPEDPHRA